MKISDEGLSAIAQHGGWFMFFCGVMHFLFAPLIGNLSDRFDRHSVLRFSMFVLGELSAYGKGNDAGMVVRRTCDLWYW